MNLREIKHNTMCNMCSLKMKITYTCIDYNSKKQNVLNTDYR